MFVAGLLRTSSPGLRTNVWVTTKWCPTLLDNTCVCLPCPFYRLSRPRHPLSWTHVLPCLILQHFVRPIITRRMALNGPKPNLRGISFNRCPVPMILPLRLQLNMSICLEAPPIRESTTLTAADPLVLPGLRSVQKLFVLIRKLTL